MSPFYVIEFHPPQDQTWQRLTTRAMLKISEGIASHFISHLITYLYLTWFRLILASVLITSKFYNDIFYGNHFVAYVGGVQLEEMNLLELEFLQYIDWSLFVDAPEYEVYLKGVH